MSQQPNTQPDLRAVAVVIGAHGLRGGLRLKPFSEHPPTWWSSLKEVWLKKGEEVAQASTVDSWQATGKHLTVRLVGLTKREQAEAAQGGVILVQEDALPPLGPGECYRDDWFETVLVSVLKNQSGTLLGKVSGLLENPAHPILEVEKETGEKVLVPLVEPCFASRFPQNGVLVVADEDWFHAL